VGGRERTRRLVDAAVLVDVTSDRKLRYIIEEQEQQRKQVEYYWHIFGLAKTQLGMSK
jgi:hypothetical protein